jgi:hypothetical protein
VEGATLSGQLAHNGQLPSKFLRPGAIGPFSGHRWPVPAGARPGEWVEGELGAGAGRARVAGALARRGARHRVTEPRLGAHGGMESSPLKPLPSGFAATVAALHEVAERIVAPARKPDNEIALEPTPAGFGTPAFEWEGATHRVRVEGAELVHEAGPAARRAPLRSLAGAAAAVEDLLPAGAELDERPLAVEEEASLALGAWYGLGAELLGQLVAEAGEAEAPTPPVLWPEHFDIAIELGSEAAGARANYGLSPGDDQHPEPYLYVGPWGGETAGELWNARGFGGAEMGYAELLEAADQRRAALEFFRLRRDALRTKEGSGR